MLKFCVHTLWKPPEPFLLSLWRSALKEERKIFRSSFRGGRLWLNEGREREIEREVHLQFKSAQLAANSDPN